MKEEGVADGVSDEFPKGGRLGRHLGNSVRPWTSLDKMAARGVFNQRVIK